jgi:hypothetical protein
MRNHGGVKPKQLFPKNNYQQIFFFCFSVLVLFVFGGFQKPGLVWVGALRLGGAHTLPGGENTNA